MNKKAIFFSLTTTMLLLSTLVFTATYLQTTKETKQIQLATLISNKLRFIQDDVIGDIYSDLFQFNSVTIERTGGETIFTCNSSCTIGSGQNYDSRMLEYEGFIESVYANRNNLNINLTNFIPQFNLNPYGTIFDLNQNTYFIYNDPVKLNSLEVVLSVEQTNYNNLKSSFTTGTVPLRIILLNNLNQTIYDQTNLVNLAGLNHVDFRFGSNTVNIDFGQFETYSPATFRVSTPIPITINQIKLNFDEDSQKTTLTGGNFSIYNLIQNLTKSGQIYLLEE
jgi:hypothetical protein